VSGPTKELPLKAPTALVTPPTPEDWGRQFSSRWTQHSLRPWFQGRIKCGKCGRRGRWVDVRPNWKEKPGMPQDWIGRPAGE
jgi:hypothetical protein